MEKATDKLTLNGILKDVEMLDAVRIQPLLSRCQTVEELKDVMDILAHRLNLSEAIHATRIRRNPSNHRPVVSGFRRTNGTY